MPPCETLAPAVEVRGRDFILDDPLGEDAGPGDICLDEK